MPNQRALANAYANNSAPLPAGMGAGASPYAAIGTPDMPGSSEPYYGVATYPGANTSGNHYFTGNDYGTGTVSQPQNPSIEINPGTPNVSVGFMNSDNNVGSRGFVPQVRGTRMNARPVSRVQQPQQGQFRPYVAPTQYYNAADRARVGGATQRQLAGSQFSSRANNAQVAAYQSRINDVSQSRPDFIGGMDANGLVHRPMLHPTTMRWNGAGNNIAGSTIQEIAANQAAASRR